MDTQVLKHIAVECGINRTEQVHIEANLVNGGVAINVFRQDEDRTGNDLITYTELEAIRPEMAQEVARRVIGRTLSRVGLELPKVGDE